MRIINIIRAILAIFSLVFFFSCSADNSSGKMAPLDQGINSLPATGQSQIGNDQNSSDDQGDIDEDQDEDDDDQGTVDDDQGEDDDDQGEDVD